MTYVEKRRTGRRAGDGYQPTQEPGKTRGNLDVENPPGTVIVDSFGIEWKVETNPSNDTLEIRDPEPIAASDIKAQVREVLEERDAEGCGPCAIDEARMLAQMALENACGRHGLQGAKRPWELVIAELDRLKADLKRDRSEWCDDCAEVARLRDENEQADAEYKRVVAGDTVTLCPHDCEAKKERDRLKAEYTRMKVLANAWASDYTHMRARNQKLREEKTDLEEALFNQPEVERLKAKNAELREEQMKDKTIEKRIKAIVRTHGLERVGEGAATMLSRINASLAARMDLIERLEAENAGFRKRLDECAACDMGPSAPNPELTAMQKRAQEAIVKHGLTVPESASSFVIVCEALDTLGEMVAEMLPNMEQAEANRKAVMAVLDNTSKIIDEARGKDAEA